MFRVLETSLAGCYVLMPSIHQDERGSLVKTFHEQAFREYGLNLEVKEEYFSTSKKNVIRGMHFQVPPHDHIKLVYCMQGKVLDVLLDLRRDSPTYGQAIGIELSQEQHEIVYIPSGIAHGFCVLSDEALMVYKTSTVRHPESEAGVLWSSFNFSWPNVAPILSARDKVLPALQDFNSPF